MGSIILRNNQDEPIGELYYTAYTRTGVSDASRRPVTFAYNGGPGSSSVWVHMGAIGPRRVVTPDTTHAPPPPYAMEDNPNTLLDVSDLVFIDPIGTGFSRPIGKGTGKDFWGVDEDASSLAQFITRWLSENQRWNSPRYLFGESYGTTRSAALADYLQSRSNVDLNGVMLISAVLDFQTIGFSPGNEMPYLLYLPSYAAVAAYHDALPQRHANMRPFLDSVETFAVTDYAQALLAGDKLDPAVRDRVIARLHQYTGLSADYLRQANLRVDASEFEKELMREHGLVVGRLDARFTGPTGDLLAQRAPYDPQSSALSSAYTSAWNSYLRGELGWTGERQYAISGNVNPWNWTHGRSGGWPGFTNVAVDLADAMQQNPKLHVLLAAGLYDLATPYYAAEWTMNHLGLPPALQNNITVTEYAAGHMMYVYGPAAAKLKRDAAQFIARTSGGAVAASASAGR